MLALLTTLSLTACETASDLFGKSASAEAKAGAAAGVLVEAKAEIAEARRIPALPADCNRRERSGATAGEAYDVIALKGDQALGRANDRVTRCYRLSERNRMAREPK